MAYFKVCCYCGDHLDPGEKCECRNKKIYIRQCRKTYRKPQGFVFVTRLDGRVELVKENANE